MSAQKVKVKKRAVAIDRIDRSIEGCRHRRCDDSLVFECRTCDRGKDLTDEVCLRKVIQALSREADVSEVVLSGEWELLFGNGCVRVLNAYAGMVRACNDGMVGENRSEACAECQGNPSRVLGDIAARLPSQWNDIRLRVRTTSPRPGCTGCTTALSNVLVRMECLSKEADRLLAKEAFHIVGVSE